MPYAISNTDFAKARSQFAHEFDAEWNRVLEQVDCRQAQLVSGNRLRPEITFWGYLAALDKKQTMQNDYIKIAQAAVSIELLHKASLLFDDWLDSDSARHGMPAFHTEHSPQMTVAFGLHLVGIAVTRIKNVLPSDQFPLNIYHSCITLLLDTIYSMSQGVLEEMRLTKQGLYDLGKIQNISRLETSEIIGNSIQLGYIVGGEPLEQASVMLKHIGNQCGYLFQTMNDMEAFGNSAKNTAHKGLANYDVDYNRKNLAAATLYELANKKDRELIKMSSGQELASIAKRYKLVDFIMNDMENVYGKMNADIHVLLKYGVSEEWVSSFSEFLSQVRDIAVKRLSR
jgi:heptaprenyl diphosphate synthase